LQKGDVVTSLAKKILVAVSAQEAANLGSLVVMIHGQSTLPGGSQADSTYAALNFQQAQVVADRDAILCFETVFIYVVALTCLAVTNGPTSSFGALEFGGPKVLVTTSAEDSSVFENPWRLGGLLSLFLP
jgi:hypothetical protein